MVLSVEIFFFFYQKQVNFMFFTAVVTKERAVQ